MSSEGIDVAFDDSVAVGEGTAAPDGAGADWSDVVSGGIELGWFEPAGEGGTPDATDVFGPAVPADLVPGGEGRSAFGFLEDPFGSGGVDGEGIDIALEPDAAIAAASAAHVFDKRADNAGVRYETLDGAIHDTLKRADVIGDGANVETSVSFYRGGDGRFVPTRIRLDRTFGADAMPSLAEAERKGAAEGAGVAVPKSGVVSEDGRMIFATGHTHNTYMHLGGERDGQPNYTWADDGSNRYSAADMNVLKALTKVAARHPDVSETVTSALATPDGSVLKAEGSFSGKLHTVKLDTSTYEYPGAGEGGALVHQPRTDGDAPAAQAPEDARRVHDQRTFQIDTRHQIANDRRFDAGYATKLSRYDGPPPELTARAASRGAGLGAWVGGTLSLAEGLADGDGLDGAEALDVAVDTAGGAAIGGASAVAEDFVAEALRPASLPLQGRIARAAARFTEAPVPLSNGSAAGGGVLLPSHHAAHAFSATGRYLFIDGASAGIVGGGVAGLVSAAERFDEVTGGDSAALGEVAADAAGGGLSGVAGMAAGRIAASTLLGGQRGASGGVTGTLAGLGAGFAVGAATEWGFDKSGAKRRVAEEMTEAIEANEAVLGTSVRTVREGGGDVLGTVDRVGGRTGRVASDTGETVFEGVRQGVRRTGETFARAGEGIAEAGGDALGTGRGMVEAGRRAVGEVRTSIGDVWKTVGGWFGGGRRDER